VIAGITREVAATQAVDRRRIYVAGLSSGAAMAVILGEAYPELYAAVGVHSGLPYAAAHDLPSAFAAMKGRGNGARRARVTQAVPTIVFHGDHDTTVDPRNGAEVAAQVQAAAGSQEAVLRARSERGTATGGRAYTRTTYADGNERVVLEQWEVHGAGHAWSGGSAGGSYTDPAGPDASAEMVRFFLSQPRGGSA
jgi:poly(3-hydroxybutyrate) depolymerase